MRLPSILSDLRQSLAPVDPRSGFSADESSALRRAAVLVLMYPRADDVTFVLTARPETLSRHPGQISLPGGVAEPEDVSLWDTAVRETREELGVRPGRIVPLGRLDDVALRVSEHVIAPFVGWNPVAPSFRPDHREVAAVLQVPLRLLLDPASIDEELWHFRDREWRVAFYRFGDHVVWGATALILHDLHARLQRGANNFSVRPGSVRPA
ncbi:MAG TPA: CoA pyrophosphatase [Chloroflexota bacterium]